MEFRLGQGYDLHRISAGRRLFLGGREIPTPGWGLLGHSDADVLLHAIIDSLLGALALGDIGQWFPDTDQRWLNADSKELLQTVLTDTRVKSWQLQNLDSTIIAQAPKLSPHILSIRQSLAELFACELERISVKAKSNEQLDAVGRQEAIAAQAVVLLAR
ncbi:MAG: 2-C-methyl-D-erythritol 2,4-cyclodiphosphate synthase [Lentisphaerae bacterium]|nr:2-C-methyl-D-erythritol 2,4-cyclodiphosphate synthase [Lentisphaerota bacterium]